MKLTTNNNVFDLRATRCEVNIRTLKNNIAIFRNKIDKNCSLCLTIKGNAYGHGIVEVAQYAQSEVDFFAVATVGEGALLRENGIVKPILLLSVHTRAEIPYVCEYNLSPFLSHNSFLEQYDYFAKHYNTKLSAHIKIDTGMSRAGFNIDNAIDNAKQIGDYENISIDGICTHFSSSDDPYCGEEVTQKQIERFNTVVDQLKKHGINPRYIHAANSAAVMNYSNSHFNMVRVGLGAYGYSTDTSVKPIMSFKTQITIVKRITKGASVSYGQTWTADRDTTIAILPVGYADGYKRCLSNKAQVMIGSKLCNVIGVVCMDQMAIELPYDFDQNDLGQDVVLFDDNHSFNAEMLASRADTIVYEILTSISDRVPRIYTNT